MVSKWKNFKEWAKKKGLIIYDTYVLLNIDTDKEVLFWNEGTIWIRKSGLGYDFRITLAENRNVEQMMKFIESLEKK